MTKLNKILVVVFVIALSMGVAVGQDNNPTDWNIGGVPAIAYNSDTGFLYGAILDIYNYGDGSVYPDYIHTTRLTWTRTTKGSGENAIFFDSKYLLPYDVRITAEAAYLTERALQFYGFNGDNNPAYENEDDDAYKSRIYYRHDRSITRLTTDLQKNIFIPNLRGIFGIAYFKTKIATVDTAKLNDGKDAADRLPPIDILYDVYKESGAINTDEALGGNTNYIKLGLVYDSRDNEPNPMSGIWTEALITTIPSGLGNDFSYTLFTGTHRQYFTIIPNDLSVAVRLGYQSVISGKIPIPFFMLPFYQSSYRTTEGLGGSKSLRGILKNRIVGNSIGFGNLEVRWKFLRTKLMGQNLYLALNGFMDAGKVLSEYGNAEYQKLNPFDDEQGLHISYGGGFRIALNENFIVAVDYGMAKDAFDGNSGLYIGLGYLY
ncbi:MAG: BamA/TamA family outer membrane protein [Planctomycetia bacterium]|nr:BamA/TamA family outer membrane protein [Planctomycetia bacterium]